MRVLNKRLWLTIFFRGAIIKKIVSLRCRRLQNLLFKIFDFDKPFLNFNGRVGSSPAVEIWGLGITYYALIIVTGMILAIVIFSQLLKKHGKDPYDSLDYALFILPFAILGARIYFFAFPYDGYKQEWSDFFRFRDGGLGIYGGVIFGYITMYIVAKIKKQDPVEISDYIAPGLLLAQSIGRWGNFVNQEAYGNLITNPAHQWFPLAVHVGDNWYQATFFYESVCTLAGFVLVMLILRSKRFRKGLAVAFYGIYYGIVRLVIEGLRSDSLYLWLGDFNTGIKISQLVSWIAITLGVYRVCNAYMPEIQTMFDKLMARMGVTTAHAAATAEAGAAEKGGMPFDRVFLYLTGEPFVKRKADDGEKEEKPEEKSSDENETSVKEGTGEVEPQKPPERKRRKTDKNKENEKQEDTEK